MCYYIASVSFGKDSLAMLLLILDNLDRGGHRYPLDEVIFFDWGMEFQAIYTNRDKIKPMLAARGIKFTELKYETSFIYNFCEREVHKKDGSIQHGYSWCGGRTRWGTDRKNATIKKYYKTLPNKDIIEYVGIAADETSRIQRALDKGQVLPLVDMNITEADALSLCYQRGFNWEENGVELYNIMDRVSCWCCKNNNLKELKNMFLYLPDYWERLKSLQEKTSFPYKDYKNAKTVSELEERFRKELSDV